MIFAVSMGIAVVGCSKPAPKEAPKAEAPKAAPKAEAPKAAAGDATVVALEANDQMKYNKNEIKVPAGKKVKLTLKNVGKMSKEVMGHNFVLLKKGADAKAFTAASATAKATDYIPEAMKGDVIAHTKILGGGESATIEFDAPAAGTYEFLCSFPGHYMLMNGKFIVE